MHFDYGYTEEGQLGKFYDLSLLKKLIPYTKPYKKTIFIALSLILMITAFDLSIPYLPKIAIDRYILSFFYPVNYSEASGNMGDDFNKKYRRLLETEEGFSFISNSNLKKIDRKDLGLYQEKGLIGREKYYKIPDELRQRVGLENSNGAIKKNGLKAYISVKNLERLSRDTMSKLKQKDLNGVLLIGVFIIFLIGSSFFLNYWEYYFLEKTGQNMMHDIRMDLFGKIQALSIKYFDGNPVGKLVTRATNDIENLNEMFKSVLITVFKDIFLLSGIIGVLIYLNWRLAMISFALLPFVFWLTLFFSRQARDVFREIRKHIASINAFLQERLTGIRIIQLFAQEKSQLDLFKDINQKNYQASMKQIKIFAVFMPSIEVFSSIGIGLIIWYGGGKVLEEQLTLGSLVAFIGYIQMFFKPIRDISEKFNIMQSAMASMERIFDLMGQKTVIHQTDAPKRPNKIEGRLQFKNVSFSYRKGFPVLDDISFEIMPGQMVALVGATGSGKTTIINLLERFYNYEKGNILLDGIDIREWDINELRSNIGLVMQDVFIFAGDIAENISLGDGNMTGEMLEEISKQGNSYKFINQLSDGMHHEIKEGGATISAGERQLLALSRALAYKPRLLILDEATSSVDPETERLIQESIFALSKKQTTLIVAHRPSTIQQADRILVMNQGRIAEQGTHDELISMENIYFKLTKLRNVNADREVF
ncbi:MAG: ABC transporter ATP-binding protein [Thermodesulfobacteriota bacterium]|nr:ABC transporter ATP-binding protein [Thermodesulfobacteriota bacterium]